MNPTFGLIRQEQDSFYALFLEYSLCRHNARLFSENLDTFKRHLNVLHHLLKVCPLYICKSNNEWATPKSFVQLNSNLFLQVHQELVQSGFFDQTIETKLEWQCSAEFELTTDINVIWYSRKSQFVMQTQPHCEFILHAACISGLYSIQLLNVKESMQSDNKTEAEIQSFRSPVQDS